MDSSSGRFGGAFHDYFLPLEGANDIALALFPFPSLATYEQIGRASCRERV